MLLKDRSLRTSGLCDKGVRLQRNCGRAASVGIGKGCLIHFSLGVGPKIKTFHLQQHKSFTQL